MSDSARLLEEARRSLALVGEGDWTPQDGHLLRVIALAVAQAAELQRLREALQHIVRMGEPRAVAPGVVQQTVCGHLERAAEVARVALAGSTAARETKEDTDE